MKIITERIKTAISHIDSKYFVRNERDFAYEFYYQLRLISYHEKINMICETEKNRFNNGYRFSKSQVAPENTCRVPDILIHYYDNRKQQLIALEIKMHPTISQLLKAFAKLAVYNKGKLRYQKSILILFYFDKNKLIEILSSTELLKNHVEVWILKPNEKIETVFDFI